jgi:hypothetical protein
MRTRERFRTLFAPNTRGKKSGLGLTMQRNVTQVTDANPGTLVEVLSFAPISLYFVPNNLSPASPNPGTMYPCSFR